MTHIKYILISLFSGEVNEILAASTVIIPTGRNAPPSGACRLQQAIPSGAKHASVINTELSSDERTEAINLCTGMHGVGGGQG